MAVKNVKKIMVDWQKKSGLQFPGKKEHYIVVQLTCMFFFSFLQTYSQIRHTEFPPDLSRLSEFIAAALQFPR